MSSQLRKKQNQSETRDLDLVLRIKGTNKYQEIIPSHWPRNRTNQNCKSDLDSKLDQMGFFSNIVPDTIGSTVQSYYLEKEFTI